MRAAVVEIAPMVLIGMLSGHPMERLETNLPADAEVHSVHWDYERQRVRVVVLSSEFAEVPDGAVFPNFAMIATRRTDMASELLNLIHRNENP